MVRTRTTVAIQGIAVAVCLLLAQAAAARPQGTAGSVRPIGVVTEIQSSQLTLRTDSGPVLKVHLPEGVSVLRVPPGAKNLKQAVQVTVGDINVGDRVLILGSVAADQKSMQATRVIDMSKAALAQEHEAQRQAWQERGLAGVVQSLNPADQSLVLGVPNRPPTPGNPTHPVTLTLHSGAKLLRYAPDSVKFSDARPAPFDEIKVGDQVSALGTKSADGTHFVAEEVVSGTFLNIPATVISVDASRQTVTVKDLQTGKPVLVRTNADSKLHRLPAFIAMMIARFNSGGAAGPEGSGKPGGAGAKGGNMAYRRGREAAGGNGHFRGMEGGMHHGGPPHDFNAMLERTPRFSLSELKPGEPLIVVSTEGAKPGEVTAIAVLTGVEPILQARPKGSQPVNLGPWNMSVGGGGASQAGGVPGP